jgi:hypothetical protein
MQGSALLAESLCLWCPEASLRQSMGSGAGVAGEYGASKRFLLSPLGVFIVTEGLAMRASDMWIRTHVWEHPSSGKRLVGLIASHGSCQTMRYGWAGVMEKEHYSRADRQKSRRQTAAEDPLAIGCSCSSSSCC